MRNRKMAVRKSAIKNKRSQRALRKRFVRPQTIRQYFAMSKVAQDEWNRVTHVVTRMREEDVSLAEASREYGLNPRTVVPLGKPALTKGAGGRYAARPTDNLLRVMVIPTSNGLREIATRDSRQASLLGAYWVAVHKYLETGDASALRKIRRKTVVDADGKRIRLITDLAELDRLGSAGVLSFESLYAKAA
jgi:hypothetical protein